MLGLQRADLDLGGAMIWIRPNARRPLKTARSQDVVPIAAELGAVLASWVPQIEAGCPWLFPGWHGTGPWLGGMARYRPVDQLGQLGRRAGVEGLTFQSLRHSWATLAEDWGLSELVVLRILRHSPEVGRRYRHRDVEVLHRAASKIRFG